MKKIGIPVLYLMAFLISCNQNEEKTKVSETDYYTNPIMPGDHPDPSILVDGKDYYVVTSSFEYYPGLPIFHSTDLLNWKPVTNALQKYVGSVWAPDLVKYDGKYYIYFPANGTNYVIKADQIEGPWSDPVELEITMIDPGHVADEQGNRYLYFSSGAYVPLSEDGLSISGEVVHSYDGWEIPIDWTIECFCMEGPKLCKRGEYYYLTVAEGGTSGPATGHMVISARSKSPLGPWENSPFNPIIRAKSPEDKWWSVGHATIFEDAYDSWYMLFHGYENGFYNRGRQALLAPIEWTEDGWFKLPDDFNLNNPIKKPQGKPLGNQYTLNDDFAGPELKPQWRFFKGYDKHRVKFNNNDLVISAKGNSVADCSPMLVIPPDHAYTAQVELVIEGNAVGGMVLFYSEKISSGILADKENVLANLRGWQFVTEKNVIDNHVFLQLKNINNIVDMYYSLDGKDWMKIENSFESSAYHHNVLSGFMSLRIGLCAIGDGKVKFNNFKYIPIK